MQKSKAQGPRNLPQVTEVAGGRASIENLLLPKYLPEWFSIMVPIIIT